MNEEEKQAIKILKSYKNPFDLGNRTRYGKSIQLIENLIIKQQKEIENYQILKDDIEGHRIAYVDTPEFEENYISKDKIKGKIEELKNRKIGASTGIFAVQVDILEELLGE